MIRALIWSEDQTPRTGSGRRYVFAKVDPAPKRCGATRRVRIYRELESYPDILHYAEYKQILIKEIH